MVEATNLRSNAENPPISLSDSTTGLGRKTGHLQATYRQSKSTNRLLFIRRRSTSDIFLKTLPCPEILVSCHSHDKRWPSQKVSRRSQSGD
jgi:hypothetical protein